MKILILGASYGSLLSTKLAMAGHDVSLVCRAQTAKLINEEGTAVRIKFRDEAEPRVIYSNAQPGNVEAVTPEDAIPENYDLIALAMQEPQYGAGNVRELMMRIASSKKPCLSIMNMPPLPYLRRIGSLQDANLDSCFSDPSVWKGFDAGLVTLCSPDPQAFRPPEEKANFLQVGLPTNFKAAEFENEEHTEMLRQLEADISETLLDGKDVPVKLRVHESLFVPMAKWSMLLTGNYRCVLRDDQQSIRDAVHTDIDVSRAIYYWVDELAQKLGARPEDQVPFMKYATAAENLLKPSSAARAVTAGSANIERVDKLVQQIGVSVGMRSEAVDSIVQIVDQRLDENRLLAS